MIYFRVGALVWVAVSALGLPQGTSDSVHRNPVSVIPLPVRTSTFEGESNIDLQVHLITHLTHQLPL